MARSYRIGEIARETGVTAEALRYYEQQGLLPKPIRSGSGARIFAEESVARVRFIKQAQSAGLTLRDIQVLVGSGRSRMACRKIRTILAARIADIEGRLVELQTFHRVLTTHLEACDRALVETNGSECPTLDAIEHGKESRR